MRDRVTMRDIGRAAGVSHMTVSLALRNHPSLPSARRREIQALARRLGYRPDPMLHALSAYRQRGRAAAHHGTIAWLNAFPDPAALRRVPEYDAYWRGAAARAAGLGYQLAEFSWTARGAARLHRILRARGISCLLLPPQPRPRAHRRFPWECYSTVAFGFTLAHPAFHVVSNAQYRSCLLAMRKLRALGYRRIGLFLDHENDEGTDRNFFAGYLAALRHAPADALPVLGVRRHPADAMRRLLTWCNQHRPEAILTDQPRTAEWLARLGLRVPGDVGVALLAVPPGDAASSGIQQRGECVGAAAVDIVTGLALRDERGLPEAPLRILVEGRWQAGRHVRRLNFSPR